MWVSIRKTTSCSVVTCSSHIKWISVFILYTLYTSYHCAFWNFELNGQRQEGKFGDITVNVNRIWPIEIQNGCLSTYCRNLNFPISTKVINQWAVFTGVLNWHNFCLKESKYFRNLSFDIQTIFQIVNKTVIKEIYRQLFCPYLSLSVCIKQHSSRWVEFREIRIRYSKTNFWNIQFLL